MQVRLGQQQSDAAVLEHVAQAILGVFRVQRHIGAAGLHDAEQTDDHLQAALHGDAHQHIRPHALLAQLVRQLVATAVELGIAQGLLAKGQRRGVRGGEDLGFDELMDALPCRVVRFGGVPAAHDDVPFRLVQQRQVGNPLPRFTYDPLQQVQPMPGHALDRRGVEQVGGVGQCRANALLVLEGIQGQVELGGMVVPDQLFHLQPLQTNTFTLGLGLVVEHHLEQRAVAQVTLDLQGLDQLLERQILMGLGAQCALLHLLQQVNEGHLQVELGP
ncbi:Uncharacterised protein [Pseudomonas putida]|nr:Uncharacterised protein [Pseudomonas putida]